VLVGEIGVTTVVDLRSPSELASEGPAPLDGVAGVRHAHHPVLPEAGAATDAASDVLPTRAERDRSRYPADPICGHYLGYLEERPDQVVGALRSVARSEGAALVHCAAGKDRTGVVVAVALSAVGVRPEAVIADYAATGERIGPLLARLRRSPTYAADMGSEPTKSHRPRPQTMVAFLEQVSSRYGGAAPGWPGTASAPMTCSLLRAKLLRP
jgi:hypothetical protein